MLEMIKAFAPPRPRGNRASGNRASGNRASGNRASGNRARGDRDIKDSTNIKLDPVMVEIPKTIDIVAWYTPQIPVSHGPGEFGGLPGLILELTTDQTVLLCSKIVINPEKKDNILMPSKGEKVTRIQYDEIVKLKTEEMKSMYQSRGMKSGRKY
jgi:hypothetical protein